MSLDAMMVWQMWLDLRIRQIERELGLTPPKPPRTDAEYDKARAKLDEPAVETGWRP